MRTEIKLITPEIAKKYLERNKTNRKCDEKLVNYFANQMNNNLWKTTGQGISLSNDNVLLDGQHRLKAIIKSGKSVKMLVVFDIDNDSFDVYDSGKKRNHTDSLYILGIQNASNISSGINRYLKTVKNESLSRYIDMPITTTEIIQIYYSDESGWQDTIKFCYQLYHKLRLYQMPVIAAMNYYLINDLGHDRIKVEIFFKKLFGLADETANEVTVLLREKLIQNAMTAQRFTTDYKDLLLSKSWNLWISDKKIKLLKLQPDELMQKLL
jgi:hypothetical protein